MLNKSRKGREIIYKERCIMIIDIHTHNFERQGTAPIVEGAKRNGIDRIVLLGDVLRHGYYPTPEQIVKINDDTAADVEKYDGFCLGFCHLNPSHAGEFQVQEMRRVLSKKNFCGVKLECSWNCRKPEMDPIMEELEKQDRILLHHCWYKTTGKCDEESDPSDIAYLARRWPNVTIVMAHLIGCGIRGVEMIADCPNVLVDTSGGQPEAGFLEYAIRRIGAERIVYGSDAPCRDYAPQLAKLEEAEISDADRELILWKNTERILKI